MLLRLDSGGFAVDDLQRGVHQDLEVAAGNQDVDQGLDPVAFVAPAHTDLEPELLTGRVAQGRTGERQIVVALLAAQFDAFAEEILDQDRGFPVHRQVGVQFGDDTLDLHLDGRDIRLVDQLQDRIDILLFRAANDELVGTRAGRDRVIGDVGGFTLFVEQLGGELLVNDLLHLLGRVESAEVDEFPFLGAADDLLDLLRWCFVDVRDGNIGVLNRLNATYVAENVLRLDGGGAFVGPVLAPLKSE